MPCYDTVWVFQLPKNRTLYGILHRYFGSISDMFYSYDRQPLPYPQARYLFGQLGNGLSGGCTIEEDLQELALLVNSDVDSVVRLVGV